MNWEQLQTILWLRWRLTRNQWMRGGNIGAVVAAVLLGIALFAAVLLFVGGLVAGIVAFKTAKPEILLLTWDIITGIFLFTWFIGLLTELQRSETIDLERLMHLPVALGQVFGINYVASHFTLSLIVCVPAMIGLAAGLSIGHSPAMLLLIPLVLATVFMVTAWTYCLRGWLSSLMSNPRRRRTILMVITLSIVLVGQLPNLYFNVIARSSSTPAANRDEARKERHARRAHEREVMATLVDAQKYIPPLWLPVAARSISENRIWPALLATAGCTLIGALGLRRAYNSTVRFYRGDSSSLSKARPNSAQPAAPAKPFKPGAVQFVERGIPGVPDEAAAVAMATFRSLSRAPEVRMQWAMGVIMTLVFGAMAIFRTSTEAPPAVKPFIATGLLTMTLFMLIQSMGNVFGFDRAGFRAFVLAPINRRFVLLGKNLANLPVVAVMGLGILIFSAIRMKLPATVILAVMFQFAILYLLVCILGNALSIMVPYRVRAGSMKPTKLPAKAQLLMFATHMLFPLVMAPAFIPSLAQILWDYAKWPAVPINLILSVALAAAAAVGYWLSLDPLARMLQAREQKMLEVLGSDVE